MTGRRIYKGFEGFYGPMSLDAAVVRAVTRTSKLLFIAVTPRRTNPQIGREHFIRS